MDIGTVVSEKTARSQIIGGIVFGIGMALLEETRYDTRNAWVANRNIAEYLIPTNADVPAIEVEFLNHPDFKFNSIGGSRNRRNWCYRNTGCHCQRGLSR